VSLPTTGTVSWWLLALVAAMGACGGGNASQAPVAPSPVSNVVVPANPPESTAERVDEPVVPEDEESPVAPPTPERDPEASNTSEPPEATIRAARSLFQIGVAAFQMGRYEDARDAFEAAHQLVPKPQVLYNLAMVEMKLGHVKEACQHLEAWMRDATPSPSRLQSMSSELQKCGIGP